MSAMESLSEKKVLDFGCGKKKREGAIGIDFDPESHANVKHDLNVFPYPFEDNTFDEIFMTHCLEHLDDLVKVMQEIHRIAKPGANLVIEAPYYSSNDAFSDPTHKHFFAARTFDYFTGQSPEFQYYSRGPRFRKDKYHIDFWQVCKLGGIRLQNYIGFGFLANKLTRFYEKYLAFIFPAQSIRYELTVIKE